MTDDVKLLPCPFCGVVDITAEYNRTVYHPDTGCILSCGVFDIERWNTRATPPDTVTLKRETVEEISTILEGMWSLLIKYFGATPDTGEVVTSDVRPLFESVCETLSRLTSEMEGKL